jgi:hypothetical protein
MACGEALAEWPVVRRMAVVVASRVVVKKCIFRWHELFLENFW